MEAEVEAGMAKPIPTSRQEIDTSKMLVTHTPNKQIIRTLHKPLRHNKVMGGDSNREAMTVDTVKPRQQTTSTLHIQLALVRQAVATVRSTMMTELARELMVTSWRQRCRDDTHERASRRVWSTIQQGPQRDP